MLAEETTINGEIWRASYTKEHSTAAQIIKNWMKEAGLSVYEDAVGNVFGRIEGNEETTVMTGSHIDTVKNGGKYDGAVGIVSAICAAEELLKEKGKPQKSIEVAALVEEEGSRFESSYIGSRAITGKLKREDLNEKDEKGISLEEAMRKAGYSPESFAKAKKENLAAFIELHVEQGPRLERRQKKIGIVSGIVGIYSYDIEIVGKQNHAGTTPMDMRLDPVAAAADFIIRLTEFAEEASDTATLTFGGINSQPGMSNVIAKKASLKLDFRDGVGGALEEIDCEVHKRAKELEKAGFEVNMHKRCNESPVLLSERIIDKIEEAAKKKNISYMKMNSGAGHDAQIFSEEVPTGMIFVQSHRGISHSPEEYTEADELLAGAEVLKEVLCSLAY